MCDVNERWIERQQADESLEKVIDRVKNFEPAEYMKWLQKFTEEWPSFEKDDWDDDKSDISYEDYMNVQMLDLFFKYIEKYANKNYIPSDSNILSEFAYCIVYNGEYYRITCETRDLYFSYSIAKYINNENVIPFEDIINPSKSTIERTKNMKDGISEMEELFTKLIENGMPIKIIEEETRKILSNIQFKNI